MRPQLLLERKCPDPPMLAHEPPRVHGRSVYFNWGHSTRTWNASQPIALPRHDGCCKVTPLCPHRAPSRTAQPVAGDLQSPPDDQWDDRDRTL